MRQLLSVLFSTLQGGVRGGLLLLALFTSVSAIYASDTKVHGIWYDFDSSTKTASVTYRGSWGNFYDDEYSGSVIIPETVTYYGTTYSVTSIGEEAFYECYSLTSVTIPNSVTSIGESAFEYCSSLTSVTIGNSVTSIGDDAFDGCSSLTSITIPNSVTSIGDYAFRGCSSLTSVTIGNSVTSIGNCAFRGCSSLTSVTIGNSVTSIGERAFEGCSSLTSVTIPNSVTSIEYYVFQNCSSLTSVTIPNSVTSIGNGAFDECSSLTSVTIGESVTSIVITAFSGCSKLTSVTINSDAIVNKAYLSSFNISDIFGSQVTEYIIGDNVKGIGKYAFYDCSSLTSVTIGESVTSIGESAFSKCSKLNSIVWNAKNYPDQSHASDAPFYNIRSQIINFVFGDSVEHIPAYLCYKMSELTSITIGNSVTSIGNSAFYGCSSLTSPVYNAHCFAYMPTSYAGAYTIPEGIKQIASRAFYDCSSLTSVTIGNSVTSIGDYAFYDCSKLTSVTINSDAIVSKAYSYDSNISHIFGSQVTEYIIGDNVKGIGKYAFNSCSSLTSMTIPNSVTSIGSSAFNGCSSLTSVTIPNSVTSIGEEAFYGCSSLTKTIYIGDIAGWCNIMFGSNYANPMYCSHNFYINDQEIKDLVIPNSVISIGGSAFYGCSSLTSVTIPNSVTSIGAHAFNSCSSLTSMTIPNSVTSIGSSAFKGCSSLTSVTIGESVTSIGEEAFYKCSSLTSVTINSDAIVNKSYSSSSNISNIFGSQVTEYIIGESVTSIGDYAFSGCSKLTSVTIGESVTSIGYYAFKDCSSLTSITCEAVISPTVGSGAFDYVDKSIPIYVPCGCVEAYKAANGWSDFTNIQEPLAEYSIKVDVNDNTMGTAKVDRNSACGNQISATPNIGYHFVQWNDGSTDAIRTLVLTQDTTLTAEFALTQSGQCGDSLYWELIDTTLHITGSGAMYNYTPDSAPWKLLISSIKTLTVAEDATKMGYDAFDGCTSLESIVWNARYGADAENEGQYVYPIFYGIRSQIKSFTFGENVEYIPTSLCSGMDKLTSVTIPNSVTSIGNSAFSGCSSIVSIIIERGNTTYDSRENCNAIIETTTNMLIVGCQNTVIPNSVTSIGDRAFDGCSSLTSITIPNSVTSIGDGAFDGCTSLESIVWNARYGADAKNDGQSVYPIFYGIRSQIKSFTFGENVEYIPTYLCYGMDKLTYVTIPTSVTSIGQGAFSDCSGLTSITIPTSMKSIGYGAFDGCTSLESIVWNARYGADAKNDGQSVYPIFYGICSQIKSFTFGENVEYIPTYLCSGMDKLTSVTIPNSVTSIGEGAFYGCSSLTSITIPNSVKSIGDWAFYDCSSLTSITIPNSVTSIGDEAFGGCSSLTSVTIPNSVKSIGNGAFSYCSSLTSVTIPNSVKSIGDWAFEDCSSLTSVTIPNSVTSIGDYAFRGCSSLTSVTIPNSVTSIGNNAFKGCMFVKDNFVNNSTLDAEANNYWGAIIADKEIDGLLIRNDTVIDCRETVTSVVIPNSVTSIGDAAFKDCSSLISVTIPNSVTSIGKGAFEDCRSLTSITIPNSVTSIGDYAFAYCRSLTSITIPNSVTSIGDGTFGECSSLTSITIPNSVTSIGDGAFGECFSLTSITIPNSVKSIGDGAFSYCSSLTSITCEAAIPPTVGSEAFEGVSETIPVYVLCEYQRDYTLDVVWGNFKFIECIESEDVTTDGVIITPSTNDVTITWPTEDNADTYAIVIEKDGEVFCTLTFNANGQLLNIAFAPGRNGNHPTQYAEQAVNGYRFTVTGLEEGTHYAYNIDVKDAANKTIKSYTGEFTTESTTAVENTHSQSPIINCQKIIRDNQLLILHDDKTYNTVGQIVE